MRLNLLLTILILFISFTFSILGFNRNILHVNYLNNDSVHVGSFDNAPPTIKSISPGKCSEYIVSKPTIKIKYFDESKIDKSSIRLLVNYEDVTNKATISDSSITYIPDKKFKRGNQVVSLEIKDLSPNKNKSNIEWYFTVGTPIYKHYRGLLHSHTSASDGHGSYSDAYYLARDKSNLDFFFITEHSNMLDNNSKCDINNASKSSEWSELVKVSDKFTCEKKFLGLYGFEMTYPYNVDNPIGHINIFNSKGFITEKHGDMMNLDNFYNFIYNQENLIGQFNHPGEKFGNFNNFEYSSKGDAIISLLEVRNGYNSDTSKNINSYDMYQLALDKGWHVAPTCNQDNHRVNFGIANEFRTVVLCSELTKDALYDALKNMRVYASEDKNLKVDYTINNLPMGSKITKCSRLNFYISAVDNDKNDKIKEIQVISNKGKIIKSKNFDSNIARLEFSMKSNKNSFYYVKIIQDNKKTSVTSPIWIK